MTKITNKILKYNSLDAIKLNMTPKDNILFIIDPRNLSSFSFIIFLDYSEISVT